MTYSLECALNDPDHLSPSAYDIAAAALYNGQQRTLALRWLLKYENSDGTWGDAFSWQYLYLCTYAAALALYVGGERHHAEKALQRLPTIPTSFPSNWTINFGGQIAALDAYAEAELGLRVSHPPEVQKDIDYDRLKWTKLITLDLFYDPAISLAGFFGEWVYTLRERIDLPRLLCHFQVENGSLSNSPSSSVFFLLACDALGFTNPSLERLRLYVQNMNPFLGQMGTLDQAPHFATAWLLLFNDPAREAIPDIEPVAVLRRALQPYGKLISTAGNSTFPGDVDTTSGAVIALNLPTEERAAIMGALEDMFECDHYLTFRHERTPAVTTNVHAVAAWAENPHTPAILDWIAGEMVETNGFPRCKWHVSPYYTLGEIGRLFAPLHHPTAQKLAVNAGEIFLNQQLPSGGWGFYSATSEETCYALLALEALREAKLLEHMRVTKALARGVDFLNSHDPDYSALWIGRSLFYVPPLERWLRQRCAKIKVNESKPITILYVEDNRSYHLIVDTCLSDDNHQVDCVESAEDALHYLEHNRPDVVILDLRLPGMSGYQAVRRMHELRPGLPIVATTAYVDRHTSAQIETHGFHGFLEKPFELHSLISCVDSVVNRGVTDT
ncbi:MAG: response regulator [Anaerolineales bacterium]|nr:response regulator [Anaerolineales bacterium]